MTIAKRLNQYLADAGVAYDVVTHPTTPSASWTAQTAHVPGDRLAKAVLVRDDGGYLVAVVPSTHKVDLELLCQATGRSVALASEEQIGRVFSDCQIGAVPPLGAAYGLETWVDETLREQPEIYFEGGDHNRLVRVRAGDFVKLEQNARWARFGRHI